MTGRDEPIRPLTRRRLLAAGLAGGTALLLAACGVQGTATPPADDPLAPTRVIPLPTGTPIPGQWRSDWSVDADLLGPASIALDSRGNLFVLDALADQIRKYDPFGKLLLGWGATGSGAGQFHFHNGALSGGGMAIDGDDFLYITDFGNRRVQKFDTNGAFVATWGTSGAGAGQLLVPTGIAAGTQGMIYVVDQGTSRIQVFTSEGDYRGGWGSKGDGDGQFTTPIGVAINSAGEVIVADAGIPRMQKFAADGRFLAGWGVQGDGAGQLIRPRGVAVDRYDTVYVTDTQKGSILKFDRGGGFVSETRGGTALATQFIDPIGIAVDGTGQVYVSDGYLKNVRKFVQS